METFVLDCNIFDLLVADTASTERVRSLTLRKKIRVLVTRTVAEELHESPFKGVPNCIPVEYSSNTVGRCSIMAAGDSLGDGTVYYEHLGTSGKTNDALIADAAACKANWLVSQDSRLCRRFKRLATNCKVVSYTEFQQLLMQHDC